MIIDLFEVEDLFYVLMIELNCNFCFFYDHLVEVVVLYILGVNYFEGDIFFGFLSGSGPCEKDLCYFVSCDLFDEKVIVKFGFGLSGRYIE